MGQGIVELCFLFLELSIFNLSSIFVHTCMYMSVHTTYLIHKELEKGHPECCCCLPWLSLFTDIGLFVCFFGFLFVVVVSIPWESLMPLRISSGFSSEPWVEL